MKKIGLYGYGEYGKKMAQSFRRFWDGEYIVTAIFDKALYGGRDSWWDLPILPPERMKAEYERRTFESVMVCVYDRETQVSLVNRIESLGIPVFYPGTEEDFADADLFLQDPKPEITVSEAQYSFHVYRNMLGAIANSHQAILFLFNEAGKINIDNQKKYYSYFKPYLLSYPFRLRDPLPEKVLLKGSYCLISKTYSSNFGHFSLEIIDGVYLLESAGYTGKYIFNDKPFARELLRLLGVSTDRLIRIQDMEPHKVYVFERLYDINHDGMGPMVYSKNVLPRMANWIKQSLHKDDGYPKRIFIKRIGIRKLLNGEDLAVKNGFRVVIPEEHSLLDQMDLFYNADIVLCPHGANSTNYLYMHKGAVFAEIFSDRWHMDINEKICKANGIHYLQLTGKACDSEQNGMKADYTVDEGEYLRLIREAEALAGTHLL